jgi:hypothetical protein
MSENQVRRFWCLVDDEQTAFYVNASLTWDVEELTKAIRQVRPHLQTIDTIDLVLWKVMLSYSPALMFLLTYLRSSTSLFQLTPRRVSTNVFLNKSTIPLSSGQAYAEAVGRLSRSS